MTRSPGFSAGKRSASAGAERSAGSAAPSPGFDEVLGNDRIKKILRLALEKGRVPNSLIFSGPEGVGKRRLAVILAQALNCERASVDPCGVCPACRKIAEGKGKYPDVWEVEPEGQWIKIGQMQEVRQAAYVRPLDARRRVFIVADADRMNDEAANCLLKILEEPPSYSHIILVTSMAHLILPTIRSRCQVLNFSPIGREEIRKMLLEKGHPEDQAGVISLLVNGNLEEAMELDWNEVQERRHEAWELFLALQRQGKDQAAFLQSYAFSRRDLVREDFRKVLSHLATFCRDANLLKSGGDPSFLLNPDYADALTNLKTRWGFEEYTKCLTKIEQVIAGLNRSFNMSLLAMSLYSLMGETSHG